VFNETAQFPAFRAPEPEPTTQGEAPLNIDFDIGASTAGATPAPDINLDAGTSLAAAPAGLDFDLGLGTGKSGAAGGPPRTEATAETAETAISIDFDLPVGDRPGQAPPPPPAVAAAVPDSGGIDFDLAPSVGGGGDLQAPAVDLGSISLDLGAGGGNGAGAAPDARWQEVATKLDLAKAYEEMGDKDGARELLKEVIKEGDTAQQQRAQTMLQAIG
jgi:pilus assembly protein FimV